MMPKNKQVRVIGQMSGTSVDGVDSVLLRINADQTASVEASLHHKYPAKIEAEIHALSHNTDHEIERAGQLGTQLAKLYAAMANQLRYENGNPNITVIGCHGQTIRHHPDCKHPFTLQLGHGAIIANLTSIITVTDFRNADIAAGGQGAPLTPAFHEAMFATSQQRRAVVNIGGLSNITILSTQADLTVRGYDTGPGNTLLDHWYRQHNDGPYDHTGAWAASGHVDNQLLANLLADSYFKLQPPKSTGREYFNLAWLESILVQHPNAQHLKAADIQATLCRLTAEPIRDALITNQIEHAYLCGGGCFNKTLVNMIAHKIPCTVATTATLGLNPLHVEASAFGWIAWRTLNQLTSTLATVTGARHNCISGVVNYPSSSE